MRAYIILFTSLIFFLQLSVAHDITPDSIESDNLAIKSDLIKNTKHGSYLDSLSKNYSDNLLTVFVNTTLHDVGANIHVKYTLNNNFSDTIKTDLKGYFYIQPKTKISSIRIQISEKNYYAFDSVYSIKNLNDSLLIVLKPKYKILLRGRVYAGGFPLENVQVTIKYKQEKYSITTLGCYVDEEEYWNCLYLGMFKQPLLFEDPKDSLEIIVQKEGFRDSYNKLQLKDYDGKIINYKLKYAHAFKEPPKQNIALKFGYSYKETWSVAIAYMHQLKIKNFTRLAIGLEGALLTSNITSNYSTFQGLPLTVAEDTYPLGLLGPRIGFSINNPRSRYFNTTIGISIPYQFPQTRIGVHPYLDCKYYIDLNKALYAEIKYIDYSLNVSEYNFDPYGNADITKNIKDYQKLLINFGLLVSF